MPIKKGSAELELIRLLWAYLLVRYLSLKKLFFHIQTTAEVQHVHLAALEFYSTNMLHGEAAGQSR